MCTSSNGLSQNEKELKLIFAGGDNSKLSMLPYIISTYMYYNATLAMTYDWFLLCWMQTNLTLYFLSSQSFISKIDPKQISKSETQST